MNTFQVNQIVKAKGEAQFVILGFRNIDGEQYAQIKEYDQHTGKTRRGEFALPVTVLRNV
jgi:hypothetical protein